MKQGLLIWSVFILALLAHPVSAEVMDKIPSTFNIWLWSLVGAVAGFIACRFRPLLGTITLALAAYLMFGIFTEALDPSVGSSIRREVGSGYPLHIGAASCLVVLGHALGILLNRQHLKRT